MGDAVIVADGVEKCYGDVEALGGVSMSIPAGEVFGLVGPNGAGKTTLVRCLSGTTDTSAGGVTLFGVPPGEANRNRLGLLPQSFAPPDRLSARELIEYYAGLYDSARDVEEVLAAVGMTDAADGRYATLSGGQQRRTLVGSSIVNDPDVLFLDEPTTGIDPAGRRAVWGLVESLAESGTTVFLTSHDMAEVERLADRVGVLVDGDLVDVGAPAELLAAYGGENRLVVETADSRDLDALAGHAVVPTDRGLRLDGIAPEEIGAIVEALGAADVSYTRLTWQEPDLETVYLELTGEVTPIAGTPTAGGAHT